jgi:haloalkane dehalogenase
MDPVIMSVGRPAWLDAQEYPFTPHYFTTDVGQMHYVDEGKGTPIVFVHGNPSWSFQFRAQIKGLSGTHRCIAPDHIGFGLSDKPYEWNYLPQGHADHLERLLESLDLREITLVVEDWGGPIGLSYALRHPDRVRNLVISNTWLWSVQGSWYYRAFSGFVGGSLGRWLIRHRNFFAKRILRMTFADKRRLTPQIHEQYLRPLGTPQERKGSWVFPGQIIGASDWLASLWSQHDLLREKRVLLVWGMKDIAFREKELNQWHNAFPQAKVVRYADAGHFVSEEKPAEMCRDIREFLDSDAP